MSHTTTIRGVVIRSEAALAKAVDNLKASGVQCELVQDAKPRMYYTDQYGKCEYVLKLNGRYDVGFKKQEDGTYTPVFDAWQEDICKQIGVAADKAHTEDEAQARHIGRLMQEYALCAAEEQAVNMGYQVAGRTTDEQGTVHLQVYVQ